MARRTARPVGRWVVLGAIGVAALWIVTSWLGGIWSGWPTPERLAAGRELFEHEWRPDDPLAGEGDGLGPVFNARSCVACHFQGQVGGGGPNENNVLAFEVLPAPDRPKILGGVVHASATRDNWLESQALVHARFPPIPGSRRVVNGCTVEVRPRPVVFFQSINTPALFGTGLIDDMSSLSISLNGASRNLSLLSRELEGDFSGTRVGRARVLPDGRVGRFGWKGQFATLEEFVATACAVELGLTNPLRAQDVPQQNVPDAKAELDIDRRQLRALVCYIENLPRPVEILPDDPHARQQALLGKQLFSTIGCADCHTPDLGGVEGIYSDFRLYVIEDEKDSSAYNELPPEIVVPHDHPRPNEWKTPPLWGVADSAPYLHDGRAPTLESAIRLHDAQAKHSRKRYEALGPDQQRAVVAFLETQRAPVAAADDPAIARD